MGIKLKITPATLLLVVACSDPAPRSAEPPVTNTTRDTASAATGCRQFAREGLKLKARTRAELEAEAGQPTSTEVRVEPNRHAADQQDSIIRLHYDGMIVQLRKPGPGGEMFEYVSVDKRRWLAFPYFKPGASMQNVIAALGQPHRTEGNNYVYECSGGEVENPVVFETENGTVQRIVFNYYVD